MKRASYLILFILLGLVAGACRQNQPTAPTSESTGAELPAESPDAEAAAGEACEMTTESDVEAIVGTEVTLTSGSCKYDAKDESKGISGEWSVEEYSDSAWTSAKGAVGGEAHPGYGDEAYSKDSGIIAQMIVKKGNKFIIITTADILGKARTHLIPLADKLVPEL